MFSLTSSLWVASACWIAGDRLWFDWRLCNGSTLHKFYLTHVQLFLLCTSTHVQLFNCAHLHMCAIVHRPLDRVYIICSSHNFLYNLDQRLRDCADSPRLCTNHKLVHKHQVQAPSTLAQSTSITSKLKSQAIAGHSWSWPHLRSKNIDDRKNLCEVCTLPSNYHH